MLGQIHRVCTPQGEIYEVMERAGGLVPLRSLNDVVLPHISKTPAHICEAVESLRANLQFSPEAEQLIIKILQFDKEMPGALEPEMLDYLEVVRKGRIKHPDPPVGARANWLSENGSTSSHNDMHDRMFHHLSRSFSSPMNVGRIPAAIIGDAYRRLDSEFELDHLLFVQCRAMMMYTRIKRGIKHPEDK